MPAAVEDESGRRQRVLRSAVARRAETRLARAQAFAGGPVDERFEDRGTRLRTIFRAVRRVQGAVVA